MTEKQFSEKFPIGKTVKYFPLSDEEKFEESTIRSEPWTLGHGQIVVKIAGRTGGVCIDHIAGCGIIILTDANR